MSETFGFCYAAVMKHPQTLTAQLALLPEERRYNIEALMKELSALTQADLRQRWQRLRKAEIEALTRDCIGRYGREFRNFSPLLRTWLGQAF